MQPRETIPSHLGAEWNLSAPPTLPEPTSGTTRISESRSCVTCHPGWEDAETELRLRLLILSLPDRFTLGLPHYQNSSPPPLIHCERGFTEPIILILKPKMEYIIVFYFKVFDAGWSSIRQGLTVAQ